MTEGILYYALGGGFVAVVGLVAGIIGLLSK